MARYDRVIKGGVVVDGTRMPRRICDVAIKNGKESGAGSRRPGVIKKFW